MSVMSKIFFFFSLIFLNVRLWDYNVCTTCALETCNTEPTSRMPVRTGDVKERRDHRVGHDGCNNTRRLHRLNLAKTGEDARSSLHQILRYRIDWPRKLSPTSYRRRIITKSLRLPSMLRNTRLTRRQMSQESRHRCPRSSVFST